MEFSKSLKLNHVFHRLYRSGNQAGNRYLVVLPLQPLPGEPGGYHRE